MGRSHALRNSRGGPSYREHRDAVQRIRVLIADPDGLARRMISNALRETTGMTVVACIADAREALELTRHYRPDVLVLDAIIAGEDSAGFVHRAHETSPETRILTISAVAEDEATIALLRAGAIGHISKDLDPDRLARLVERAAAGEAIISRTLVTELLDLLREVPETGWRPLHSRLTTREWEVVELLAEEGSTEQIADTLVLSTETVYSHIKSLLRKLGVTCRQEAVTAAQQLRQEEVSGKNPPSVAA
jgi:two-component system nitrate/nitrite response regulator NarL